jgi:hypothetical protein
MAQGHAVVDFSEVIRFMAGTHPQKQRKSYSKPILTVYGNIRELTQSVGFTGGLDGGGGTGGPNKTTFGGPGVRPKKAL